MKRLWLAVLAAACVALFVGSGVPSRAAEDGKPAVRVGTLDARSVSLAYHRSTVFNDWVKENVAEHKKAKEAGDTKKAKEIEERMSREQDNAHRQVFGVGPYDTLAEQLKPIFADVAKSQNLDVIVPKVYYSTPNVQITDVTPAILDELKVDEKTRKMIDEMNEKIRSGQYRPEEFKGEKD